MKYRIVDLFIILNAVVFLSACSKIQPHNNIDKINSVTGPIPSSELGVTLSHEHIMSNFGKDISEAANYDTSQLLNQVVPYLRKLKSIGVESIFDCTTEYFGRRVGLLKLISDSTGIQIITNTGFYGAANDRYIPDFAYTANAESISKIWIDEFENGINQTNVKPGFIKLAFDEGIPSSIDKKLFKAGILTHLKTGLSLAVHTGNNIKAVRTQIELLANNDIHPSAWIWVHANKVEDDNILIELASKGAWISLDGVNESNTPEYIKRIKLFKQKNLIDKILLSHDGNGFPGGRQIRKFDAILVNLIPELLKNGFSKNDIDQILIENPREAFEIKIKNL